ncbi:IucA/IucC family protein [Streptomyces sp. H27-D2]|uniref:IucA/IucC family protein n=1 Tax=Streptomyces sp. H27-D2 TaxID=3046304 RepID=UPI002DB79D80|nr:IucA/IucC family protein [Streptomyces sp. H27-D2]MEC4020977.1 IucA/IucC family protein [Streptomyces sp. H27-D2]
MLLRVLSALLREDVLGLRTRSTRIERPDGDWLRLAADDARGAGGARAAGSGETLLPPVPEGDEALPSSATGGGEALLLPVADDGFQCESAARLPLLVRESDGRELRGCDEVVGALSALADPVDRAGYAAFAEECRQTLATMRLHASSRDEVADLLTARHGANPADWTGLADGLAHDTLAARLDHPVYPTARGRAGLTDDQLRSYAPEFHPSFELRWIAVPQDALTVGGGPGPGPGPGHAAATAPGAGGRPAYWPTPGDLGLPALDGSHLAIPVHPLSLGDPLRDALRATGLEGRAVLADRPYLEVVPTLSMRTVALTRDPTLHLKLPLATATLGLLNRRTIKPGTLTDGAAGQRLAAAVIAREPRFRESVLLADESRFAHAGHELLAVLLRRYPTGLDDAVVVTMAALLSEAPRGGLVIDHLAERFYGDEPLALLDACLTLLFDWQTTLFGYGIALESHQQNISLVLDRDAAGSTRLRLLFKDNDGPRVNTGRLRVTLGEHVPGPAEFDDARIFGADDGPLADLFTTITVHLCAGAYAFGLARHGRAPLERLLQLVTDRLSEAVDRLCAADDRRGAGPDGPGATLRARLFDAPRLPVKAMVTAGTLLTKDRSGAADVNKHYVTGPNYLLRERGR